MIRFGTHAPELRRDGWDLIPIAPGTKAPRLKGWQNGLSVEQVEHLAANGCATYSIGLLAANFPGVDIDVTDEACALAIEAIALNVLGPAPSRVGQAPKRLLLYGTDKPFAKMKIFLRGPAGTKGADGKDYAVEVLGQGQQYLIYGQHPSGAEYQWVSGSGPGSNFLVIEPYPIDAAGVQRFFAALAEPGALPDGWSLVEAGAGGGAVRPQPDTNGHGRTQPDTNGHGRTRTDTNGHGRTQAVASGHERSRTDNTLGELALVDDDAFANLKSPLDEWTLPRVRFELLAYLDPSCGYEEWMDVARALHHQGQGADEWLAAFDEWSEPGAGYAQGLCADKWQTLSTTRAGGGAMTLATLIKRVKDVHAKTLDGLPALIEAETDLRNIELHIAPRIAKIKSLTTVERESLVLLIGKRLKTLGAPVGVAVVREWCRYQAPTSNAPEWVKDWVYITSGDKFFNIKTKGETTALGFNAMHNRLMPMDRDGNRERADRAALEQWNIPTVAHKGYMPALPSIFQIDGQSWVNMYREGSAAEMPDAYTDKDLAAIETVEAHMALMFPDARERELLLSWLAFNVQNPGVKIRWAVVLHGVQGDGKSWFFDLLREMLGAINVSTINASLLTSNFNDWAAGASVMNIDELKANSYDRVDVMNQLKPVMSNSMISIHPKGRPAYMAPNITNYFITTNYLDGVPQTDAERRYMVLSSALTTATVKTMGADGYYSRLFGSLKHAGALRKWMLGVELHPEFDADRHAPITKILSTIVAMSKSDLAYAIEELLEAGAEGVTATVLSSSHFTAALKARGMDRIYGKSVHSTLGNLGFKLLLGRKWWRGDARKIWVKSETPMTVDEAVAILDQGPVHVDFLE